MYRQKQVEAGMALLDERNPGWEGRINVDWLDLFSGTYCVLGQLYRMFDNGVEELGLTVSESAEYGFYLTDKDFSYDHYTALTQTWKSLLAKRGVGVEEKQPVDVYEVPTVRGPSLPLTMVFSEAEISRMQESQWAIDELMASFSFAMQELGVVESDPVEEKELVLV